MSKFASLGLAIDRPFRQLLVRPDGLPLKDKDGVQAYVDVYSTDSRLANEMQRAGIDRQIAGERRTADTLEQDAVGRLAALTAGWYLVGFDGAPLNIPFSRNEALDLYADPSCEWIRDQVSAGAAKRANFTPALPSA